MYSSNQDGGSKWRNAVERISKKPGKVFDVKEKLQSAADAVKSNSKTSNKWKSAAEAVKSNSKTSNKWKSAAEAVQNNSNTPSKLQSAAEAVQNNSNTLSKLQSAAEAVQNNSNTPDEISNITTPSLKEPTVLDVPVEVSSTNPSKMTNVESAPKGQNIFNKFKSGMNMIIPSSFRRDSSTTQPVFDNINYPDPSQQLTNVQSAPKKQSFFNKLKSKFRTNSQNDTSTGQNPPTTSVNIPDVNVTEQKKPIVLDTEPVIRYYNDALDTFTYIVVVLIISFFIFLILKDLYKSLKLYYANTRIPVEKMNYFFGKVAPHDDDNKFDTNDYRNNNWTESIKHMMDKKNKVLEDEFNIIRSFKKINNLPADLHTSISIANIKDSDDEYEYNKKNGKSFIEALFYKPTHYKYINNSDFRY